jgi:pyrroline-5-carboxylate reductase
VAQTRNTPVAFLGGGRITGALCAGLRLVGDGREIVVYDRNPEKLKRLRRESRVEMARDVKSAVDRAGILVIAVRPESVGEILEEVVASGAEPRLCVSLAAGIPLKNLRQVIPAAEWVRAMPSPVCRVGRGLTGLCFERGVGKRDRAAVRELFARVGQVAEVPEQKFDAFTATYSSSHGYHALAALASAAEKSGLDRNTSLIAAAHALADGILYWRESGSDLAELLHEAATPGGIAAATMMAMDRTGYTRAVREGLTAGIRQARSNAARTQK